MTDPQQGPVTSWFKIWHESHSHSPLLAVTYIIFAFAGMLYDFVVTGSFWGTTIVGGVMVTVAGLSFAVMIGRYYKAQSTEVSGA